MQSSESVTQMPLNGVFSSDVGQLWFVGSFCCGSARYLHVFVAGCGPIFNSSKSEGIKLSFKGVEGWEWLQKMRNSRYSPYGFVSSDFEADRFKCNRFWRVSFQNFCCRFIFRFKGFEILCGHFPTKTTVLQRCLLYGVDTVDSHAFWMGSTRWDSGAFCVG